LSDDRHVLTALKLTGVEEAPGLHDERVYEGPPLGRAEHEQRLGLLVW
jgi:hypothetical protein